MSNISILRQVIDLQAQAERLIRTGGNIPEIEAFSEYNEDVKAYLLNNIKDEFLLNYIKTIPRLDFDKTETKSNIFITIISLLFGSLGPNYREKDLIERCLNQIKLISEKYSSYEVMITNYFET